MKLYIAEKPSLAAAIFKGLGGNTSTQKKNGYFESGDNVVTWCFGHMLALFDPQDYDTKYKKWALDDLPIKATFPPTLKPILKSKAQLDIILSLLKKSDSAVHAGDPDDEGNLLIDEILTYADYKKDVKRLLISDMNEKPVKAALANLKPNKDFTGHTNSALARSIGDQMFGYNLSRAFTLKAQEKGFDGVLSVGRVQTAVLGLINQRTLENAGHTESFYYDVNATFLVNNTLTIPTKFVPDDKIDVDDKKRIIDKSIATSVIDDCTGKTATVASNVKSTQKTDPPLPFDLATLQIQCSQKFGFSADETLSTIQSLYEKHKLLTYPRSDCRYLSDEHYHDAHNISLAIMQVDERFSTVTEGADFSLKHKCFNAKKITAHHAIIPTGKKASAADLSAKEKQVYELVARSFLALFYPPALRDKQRLTLTCDTHAFVATSTVIIKKGWESLYGNLKDGENNEDCDSDISAINKGDLATCKDIAITAKKTKPPRYFVESSLLAAMTKSAKFIKSPELRAALELKDKDNSAEHGSIGTPATRASILKKLSTQPIIEIVTVKGYKEKVWKTTQSGQEFCALLPPEIIVPDVSALWARDQLQIKKGSMEITTFLRELDTYIAARVNDVKEKGVSITDTSKHHCPKCTKGLRLRTVKATKKKFWACSAYPECKSTFPNVKGKPDFTIKPTSTTARRVTSETEKCETCEKPLKRLPAKREGVFWWACTGCVARYYDDKKTEKPAKRIN